MAHEHYIEYAPTARSRCSVCLFPISLSALRLGCLDSQHPVWRHWFCATAHAIPCFKDNGELKSSMQWLKEEDYKMVDQYLKRVWGRGKGEGVSKKKANSKKTSTGSAGKKDGKLAGKKDGKVGKKERKVGGRTTRNSMRAAGLI